MIGAAIPELDVVESYELLIGEDDGGAIYARHLRAISADDRRRTSYWQEGRHAGWQAGFWIGVLGGILLGALATTIVPWLWRLTR